MYLLKKIRVKLNRFFDNLLRIVCSSFFARLARIGDCVFFESFPELDGSPWMIYKEMKKRDFDKRYKLIWLVGKNYELPDDVLSLPIFGERSFIKKIRYYWILAKAKVIVDSNRFVYKVNPKTFRLHTQHGAPLKNCLGYTEQLGNVDAILSLSDNLIESQEKLYTSAKGKFYSLGYPTNDRLFDNVDLYKNGFWEYVTSSSMRYSKIIGWLPTYRQHTKNGAGSKRVFPYGVPLLYSEEDFKLLNDLLKNRNMLLVVQMHHAQAKNFPVLNFSNIILVSQQQKEKLKVSTANLMSCFDAMITDYSAAYHEYILLDRPVALSVDDYDDYAENPGFCIDYFEWIKGVYLKNSKDLIQFVNDVSNGIDSAKIERNSAKERIHKYLDNHSTERVVDYICEKVKL